MENTKEKEKENELLELLKHEKSLTQVCEALQMDDYEVLGLIKKIKDEGSNIVVNLKDDDIYMIMLDEEILLLVALFIIKIKKLIRLLVKEKL